MAESHAYCSRDGISARQLSYAHVSGLIAHLPRLHWVRQAFETAIWYRIGQIVEDSPRLLREAKRRGDRDYLLQGLIEKTDIHPSILHKYVLRRWRGEAWHLGPDNPPLPPQCTSCGLSLRGKCRWNIEGDSKFYLTQLSSSEMSSIVAELPVSHIFREWFEVYLGRHLHYAMLPTDAATYTSQWDMASVLTARTGIDPRIAYRFVGRKWPRYAWTWPGPQIFHYEKRDWTCLRCYLPLEIVGGIPMPLEATYAQVFT